MKVSFVIHFMIGFAVLLLGSVFIERLTDQRIWKYIILSLLFAILTIWTQKMENAANKTIPFWLGLLLLIVYLAAGMWMNSLFIEKV
ncbi:hypothetical protein ACFQPF_00900 [Fictibacillus iocasae]|uniref:Uncharacterized protein n=1 Tax=Fictibacillus iocasae TaxID=2715437 RepID=A0ABW2NIC6_9BACL